VFANIWPVICTRPCQHAPSTLNSSPYSLLKSTPAFWSQSVCFSPCTLPTPPSTLYISLFSSSRHLWPLLEVKVGAKFALFPHSERRFGFTTTTREQKWHRCFLQSKLSFVPTSPPCNSTARQTWSTLKTSTVFQEHFECLSRLTACSRALLETRTLTAMGRSGYDLTDPGRDKSSAAAITMKWHEEKIAKETVQC
jgi:hypothetical protein